MNTHPELFNLLRLIALIGMLLLLLLGLDSPIAWTLAGGGVAGMVALDWQEQFTRGR